MLLFFKALLPGHGGRDLFAMPVHVEGYTTAAGTVVPAHTATRKKRFVVRAPAGAHAADLFAPRAEPAKVEAKPARAEAAPVMREALLHADQKTYETAVYAAAQAHFDAGETVHYGNALRSVPISPAARDHLRLHNGQIEARQGKNWVSMSGQPLDSLAHGLGLPSSGDRIKAQAEATTPEQHAATEKKLADAAVTLRPHMAQAERLRQASLANPTHANEATHYATLADLKAKAKALGVDTYQLDDMMRAYDAEEPEAAPADPKDGGAKVEIELEPAVVLRSMLAQRHSALQASMDRHTPERARAFADADEALRGMASHLGITDEGLAAVIRSHGHAARTEADKAVAAPAPEPAPSAEDGPIAKPEDVDYDYARQAHTWNSMMPERRARDVQQGYADHVNGLHAELGKLAHSPEQKALLRTEMKGYASRYLQHLNIVLSARGRTASPMVTGPAKFNTRGNEKRLDAERHRVEEAAAWQDRAQKDIRQKLAAARGPDQVKADLLASYKKGVLHNMGIVGSIDSPNGQYRGFDRATFVSSTAKIIKQAAAMGHPDVARELLAFVREHQGKLPKPVFSPAHPVWKVGAAA